MTKKITTTTTTVVTETTEGSLRNHIAIILDRSGSMETLRREAVDGFNQQVDTILKEAAKTGQETYVTFRTFSTTPDEPKFWEQKTDRLTKLNHEEYACDGMTAMYDAVGQTVSRLKELPDANDPNTAFLVVIISDGYENNSKEWSSERLAKLIQSLQETKRWTFTYLGSNQDLSKVSKALNIPLGNTVTFTADSAGYTGMSSSSSNATSSWYTTRSTGGTQRDNLYDKK